MPLRTVNICGLDVLALTPDEVLAELLRRIEAGVGTRVVTLNVEMIARARRDREYAQWLSSADLIIPDGMPIVWAMRKKLPKSVSLVRVTGVDLTQSLLLNVKSDWVGIIGGKDPMLALGRIGVTEPSRAIINSSILEPSEGQFDALAAEFAQCRLLFLALGVPKQDAFAVGLRSRLTAATFIPNGGSFELLAGLMPRAPRWMQLSGLEWFFRLCVEPRRLWRRYLVEYWSGVFSLLKNQSIHS